MNRRTYLFIESYYYAKKTFFSSVKSDALTSPSPLISDAEVAKYGVFLLFTSSY